MLRDRPAVLAGRSASNPSMKARARRRGSTRANRPATRPISSSSIPCHRAGSTLWPAATARLSRVGTTRDDHRSGRSASSTPHHKITNLERGHRTLVITRKGGEVVTIPLAPRTARAIDLTVGEPTDGPILLTADGRRLDRHGAGRIVRRIARRASITKPVGPRTLRHAFITAALDAGGPLRDVQEAAPHADPRTTRSGPRLPRPARHLHRGGLRRRSRPVRTQPSWHASAWASPRQADRDRYHRQSRRNRTRTAVLGASAAG